MNRERKPKQLSFLKSRKSDYGGDLRNTREGRKGARPLTTRTTMHLVLRSSRAKGAWSFKRPENEKKIRAVLDKFSTRHGVRIVSMANVGNHLHFQVKLSNRHIYKPFIRAVTAAIAMAITGRSRWTSGGLEKRARNNSPSARDRLGFWDRRPWTRIIESFQALLNLRDYILVNRMEGYGYRRDDARWLIARAREPDS